MATVTQRLAFLISANAEQAVKAFDKTAAAAEKQMGKAGKSIDKLGVSMTKFGAAGLASAGTLGGALFKLAQGAIEDQKAQALLADQLRKSTGATDAQIKKVEELIDATARATGVADDQLRPALGNLVRAFGDTGKATTVLRTALDISAATGRDLETVTIALGRAANGNVGALSRLGIPLDENVKKSKDFEAALKALNAQFGGAAAARADTYAGKLDRAKVAISEAGEQIGSAFIPVVEKSATTLAGAVNRISDLDKATGGAIGKFAAFGTVGLGVVSALSLIGGQAIKLRERFTEVGAEGERQLNKLGQAAKFTGIALGTIAASEAAFAVLNQVSDAAGKTDRSLQGLNIALAKASADEIVRSFRDLVKQEDGVLRFSNIWSDLGKEITIVGGSSSRNIEDIDRAFNKLLKESGPKAAQALVDALKSQSAQLDTSSGQYKDNAMLVERYQKRIDLLVGSTKALGDINQTTNATLQETQANYRALSRVLLDIEDKNAAAVFDKLKARQEAFKEAQAEAARKAQAFKQSILDQAKAIKSNLNTALETAKGRLEAAIAAYKGYQSQVAGAVTGTLNLGAAQATASQNAQAIADAQTKVNEEQAKLNALLSDGKADQADVAAARRDLADATTALNTALKAPVDFLAVFKNQEAAAKQFAGNVQKLLDLGADRAVIDQLLSAGADTGNQIAASILSGADPAGKVAEINSIVASTQKIADDLGTNAADKYFKNGVTLAENLVAGINSVLGKAKIRLSWKNLNKEGKPAKTLNSLKDLFQSDITGMFSLAGIGEDVPQLAEGGIVRARRGGTLALLGEGGRDEAVIPLPANGGGAGTTIQLTVNAGMGADGTSIGRQIVDELVAYQRRVGALPIKVAG